MKKRNFLTTAALVAAVATQMAMPIMAAETNNKLDKIDTSTDYTADDLKNYGHTQFGVIEADKVGSNQLSVEVPLYVTMAAVSDTSDMIVPTVYAIKNTGKPVYAADGSVKEGNIGVTAIATEAVQGSTWTIVADEGDIDTDKKMTFSLGGIALNSAGADLYDSYKDVAATNEFVIKGATADDNTLVPIKPDDTLEPTIASKIQNTSRANGTGKTVGVVKVKYQFAALDADDKPITANTYVGDNRTDAGYDN